MLYRFTIGSGPLLGCLIWLGVSPAYAQIDQERIQLILKLPPQKSAVYKAIKRLAGKVAGQSLPLTKCEMWSVPKENAEAVKQVSLDMVSNGRIRNCSRFLSQEKRWRPAHILIAKSWHETCLTSIYSLVL